jgi:hypothetical protein
MKNVRILDLSSNNKIKITNLSQLAKLDILVLVNIALTSLK